MGLELLKNIRVLSYHPNNQNEIRIAYMQKRSLSTTWPQIPKKKHWWGVRRFNPTLLNDSIKAPFVST
jgi:hypothetical protein